MRSALPLLALLALAACRDQPSVAEQFNTLAGEVENKGREYEAEAENLVAEQERRYANEAEALFQQNANALGNAGADVEVDLNAQ
ncbi:MAG TPA: hypothetical protein VEW25_10305 [Allosphingosinicella sp.]|nr:hypothetical protein [Allosphingosinicella sp.]